jgi:predicted DNA-binding protein (UPF0251 family)
MTKKGRPKKIRLIQKMPKIVQFSPRGRPGRPDEVELTLDEFEAFKLADYQGFSQAQGAFAMRLSRASFGRILREARWKIADALANGKAIRIRMGGVQVGVRKADFTMESLNQEVAKFDLRTKKMVSEMAKITRASKDAPDVQPDRKRV